MRDKVDIKLILLVIIFTYIILSIIRSSGLLILAYTDNYFYNFDFNPNQYIDKIVIYKNVFYIGTYLLGIITSLLFGFIFKISIRKYIIWAFIGLVLFWFIDGTIVRPLFDFSDSARINIWVHLVFFITAFLFSFFYIRKGQSGHRPN